MSRLHVRLSLCVEYDGDRIDEEDCLDDLMIMVEGITDAFPTHDAVEHVTIFGHQAIA